MSQLSGVDSVYDLVIEQGFLTGGKCEDLGR